MFLRAIHAVRRIGLPLATVPQNRGTPGMLGRSPAFWLDVAVKVALVAVLAFGAFSGLQQFEGKAFGWRLGTYPIAALIIPIAWKLRGRGRPYPYAADILIVLPFLIDVLGNAADFYDTITWWDDANHFANWALLSGGAGALAWRTRLGGWEIFTLIVGFGAVTAILWEIGEYYAFIRNSPEFVTAYRDTLGDLGLGLIGSLLAGVLFFVAYQRQGVPRVRE